jgi:hypothetical protein
VIKSNFNKVLVMGAIACFLPPAVWAGKAESEAAMADILFEFDELRHEQVAYRVRRSGWVDATLDDDVPTRLQGELIDRVRDHPEIPGITAGTANICE